MYEQESLRSPIKPSQHSERRITAKSLYQGIPLSKIYKQRQGRYDYNFPADSDPESDDDELRIIHQRNKIEIALKSREAVMTRITDNNEFIFDNRGKALKIEDVLTKEAKNLRNGNFKQQIGPNVKVANKFRREYVHPNRLPLVEV